MFAVNPANAQGVVTYTATEYDNLGEAIETQQYEYKGTATVDLAMVAAAAAEGDTKLNTSDLLLAQSSTAYDSLGQVYQTNAYQIDSSGNVLPTETQTTNYWYDADGNEVALEDPVGNVTTWTYDGLGEATQSFQGQMLAAGSTSTPFNDLTLTPNESRTFEVYVQLPSAPTGSWPYGYSVSDGTLTQPTGTAPQLGGGWYDLGSVTLAANDNSPSIAVNYGSTSGTEGVCLAGYGNQSDYDAAGELTETIDRDGRATTYAYDGVGRTTGETWYNALSAQTETISYVYNPAGYLESATDQVTGSDPAIDSYTYDAAGEVTSEAETNPGLTPVVTLSDAYTAGHRTTLSASIGSTNDFVNTYSYSSLLGQMSSETQTGVGVATKSVAFTYDNAGEFSTITRYADTGQTEVVAQATYGYDNLGELTSLVYKDHTGATLVGYGWTFDPLGNIKTATTTFEGTPTTVTYSSDSTGQLTSDGQTNQSYQYDANGNRETVTTGNNSPVSSTTGINNELLFDGTYNYAYDAEGNCVARWQAGGAAESQIGSDATDIRIFTWDNRDRMTSVTDYANYDAYTGTGTYTAPTPTQTVRYVYDAFNRWIGETITTYPGGVATVSESCRFVYDGNQIVLQFDRTDGNAMAASDLSHRYLWGPAVDQLMADEQVSNGLTQPASWLGR